jgi:adenine-specific DNA methylase
MEGPRAAAARAGEVRYVGGTCRRCGNTQRYTSNGNCCVCNDRQAEARKQQIAAMLRAAKAKAAGG